LAHPVRQVTTLNSLSGCGKSSIISLIERFYDPTEGRLLYNEADLKEIDNKWYHQKQLAIV
jgi:ABC-type multidrug transport system fused ATPase/permease subunit